MRSTLEPTEGQTFSFPPGPPGGLSFSDYFFRYRPDPARYLLEIAGEYGDFVRFTERPWNAVLAVHPDSVREVLTSPGGLIQGSSIEWLKLVIGDGLLASEGDLHLRQRRLLQPAFHKDRIAGYGRIMTDVAGSVRDGWQDSATIDIHEELMAATLQIVARALFGSYLSHGARSIAKAESYALKYVSDRSNDPFGKMLHRLPLPGVLRFKKAMRRLDMAIDRILAERRVNNRDTGDLLSMLVAARDEHDGGMSDRQVRDEIMTLFLAGHETTAVALTWTLYLLATHPDVARKLEAEIDGVLGNLPPRTGDIPSLTYTERVLSEALRLYPPAWAMARRTTASTRLGPYLLPAGSEIVVSQWVTHHDARWYPAPFVFDPERWTPAARASRPKYAYFPFGGGGRQCIGEGFAWLEASLLLATFVQRWRFHIAPGQRIATNPLITLRPRYGMKMILERRR